MSHKFRKSEKGQSLIFVALLLVAFMALLALVLDGGMGYFQRRNAQNAADAGALAGARVYCETESVSDGVQAAETYVTANDALLYEPVYIDTTARKVTVKTQITFNTTFGNLLGRSDITAVAKAVAGCYSPTLAEGVLPVIWFCEPSLGGGGGGPVGEYKCMEDFIEWGDDPPIAPPPGGPGTLTWYLQHPTQPDGNIWPELYIVMDSLNYNEDFPCIEDGGTEIYCDLDGDGTVDHFAGGGRSWANLDGHQNLNPPALNCTPLSSEGSPELVYWINIGFDCDLFTHTWVPETTGDKNTLFAAAQNRAATDPLVILPVFDDFCLDENPYNVHDCDSDGTDEWHSPEDSIRHDQVTYFHLRDFAPFYITCVKRNPSDYCPGADHFKTVNTGVIPNINSVSTIEGYFLEGYLPGFKGRGDDPFLSRVFTVYLDE